MMTLDFLLFFFFYSFLILFERGGILDMYDALAQLNGDDPGLDLLAAAQCRPPPIIMT